MKVVWKKWISPTKVVLKKWILQEKIRDIFDKSIDPNKIMKEIELYLDRKIDVNNTVIFFDEIQVSERAITSLKYFCEDKLPYKIICAGSLLGVKLNRFKSSFPVGKVIIKIRTKSFFISKK